MPDKSSLDMLFSPRVVVKHILLLFLGAFVIPGYAELPEELRKAHFQLEIDRENYLDALTLMTEQDIDNYPADYGTALLYYLEDFEEAKSFMFAATEDPKKLEPHERFRLGKAFHSAGQCIEALKAFKPLKNRIIPDLKQEWAYYRSECFLSLGSKKRSGAALLDTVDGLWVSHAYYNLAMAHNESTLNKNKAIKALLVAAESNQNKTKLERELNDRIYYAIGAISLAEGEADQAERFFKKIHLDSNIAAQALYMNGVIKLNLRDFRAATQSWTRTKKYPTIVPGAAESLLAIPFAYEGAGYKAQAIEAYLEAGRIFKKEVQNINKVIDSIKTYGVRKVLIEENKIEGLEWFLAKDVALNTQRAAFYSHLASDPFIYGIMVKLLELSRLDDRLALWQETLDTFKKSLSFKIKSFTASSQKFNLKAALSEFERIEAAISTYGARGLDTVALNDLVESSKTLKARIDSTKTNVAQGQKKLKSQLKKVNDLIKKTNAQRKALGEFIEKYEAFVNKASLKRMDDLRFHITAHYERSDQGLVHILEAIAESRTAPHADFDGRFR